MKFQFLVETNNPAEVSIITKAFEILQVSLANGNKPVVVEDKPVVETPKPVVPVVETPKPVVQEVEKDLIQEALLAAKGNVNIAAEFLGLKPFTLLDKMRELGIENKPVETVKPVIPTKTGFSAKKNTGSGKVEENPLSQWRIVHDDQGNPLISYDIDKSGRPVLSDHTKMTLGENVIEVTATGVFLNGKPSSFNGIGKFIYGEDVVYPRMKILNDLKNLHPEWPEME